MEPGSRHERNALAFLELLAGCGGYKLRPPSYLTTQNIALLEMKMTDGDADEKRDKVNVYLFLQAAPGVSVARAMRAFRRAIPDRGRDGAWEDLLCEWVEPFLGTLTPQIRQDLEEQLETLPEADAARVTAEPPPGGTGSRHDPN